MKDFNHSETASYNTLARTLCQVNFLPCIDEFDKNFSYDFSLRIPSIIQTWPQFGDQNFFHQFALPM